MNESKNDENVILGQCGSILYSSYYFLLTLQGSGKAFKNGHDAALDDLQYQNSHKLQIILKVKKGVAQTARVVSLLYTVE